MCKDLYNTLKEGETNLFFLCRGETLRVREQQTIGEEERREITRKWWKQAEETFEKCVKERKQGRGVETQIKGIRQLIPLNSLITSSHTGLGCHGNVYMTPYPAEAKTGMAHIMLNPLFTWHNPS